jgi:N-acyl-D-amino-acid deacylase
MTCPLSRRRFIQAAGAAAAAAAVAGPTLIIPACSKSGDFDLVVAGGLLYDGLGGPPIPADIGLSGGLVKAVGRLSYSRRSPVIEARGLSVAPGFIDVHDHTDFALLANPKAESAVRQGVTTLVSGNCGSSPFPIAEEVFEETKTKAKAQFGVDISWRDLKGFFAAIEKGGTALNYATLVGHGAVRGAAMGFNDRAPKPDDMEKMKALLSAALQDGALGLSTGLEYTPGSFAAPAEVTALCRIVAEAGGVYATHMRDEGDGLLDSLRESIDTAKSAGVKLQISHFKTAFPRNWKKIDAALALIEGARRDGLDITCDRYPYIAGSTGLSLHFPAWARQGTTDEFLMRLKDPYQDKKMREYVAEREKKLGSWDKVVISDVVTEKNKWTEGLDVLEASKRAGKSAYEFMRDLIIEERDAVGMVLFMMSEDNLKRILAHPLIGVGSDSSVRAPYGVLFAGKPHPRTYGTFPRILAKYVREYKIASAETMIMKMTSRAAAKFGLAGRGVVKPGACADLFVFDPAAVADRATWKDPHQYPAGIIHVVVNGVAVVNGGEHTGKLPGRVLRKATPA